MKRRGRGIACMWYPIGFTVDANPSAATVKVNEDGTATVLTGTVETGQGLGEPPSVLPWEELRAQAASGRLLEFLLTRSVTENTMRRGFAPEDLAASAEGG